MQSALIPRPEGASFWLRDARGAACLLDAPQGPVDHEGLTRFDLKVEDGRIAGLAPLGTAPPEAPSLEGGQAWPAFVDAHTHLDKGHIWQRAPNPNGDFAGAVSSVMADSTAHWAEAEMEARADFALRSAFAHGTTAIRTHLDSEVPLARMSWPLFARLREAWAGRITLQLCSIAPMECLVGEEGAALADLVARSGGVLGMVTRLGGDFAAPLPADFQPMLDHVFALAEARGLDLDLHVDESGETGARALREIAATALRRRFRGQIQVGHCCVLTLQPEAHQRETLALMAEARMRVVVLPMCNMYLQDRVPGRTPRWRGVTLVQEMRAAGIPVSFASDNTRDGFHAYGDLDMLEVYREATRILHLDHPFGAWPRAVTAEPAAAMGLAAGRLSVGAPADLVLFSARHMTELLSRPQSDRVVLRGGRVSDATLPDWRELDRWLQPGPPSPGDAPAR
ncbi:cytosine deaminase [Sediminicoccus sp. KRV36]|uniref:cytosine deaminase n=1 Tax=Sediminicoccus sp. KRV36 TaxID=3133721 RepID=UPI00200E84BA|nr:cytosine deaminase [Sediminicoccus rosea]UPY36970.1 cytosine deaminase [Sediminicoccus rosea]